MKQTNQEVPKFEDIKEVKPIYAVMTEQKILDLPNLEVAQKIAKKTNSSVWEMLREGDKITFIYPIKLD